MARTAFDALASRLDAGALDWVGYLSTRAFMATIMARGSTRKHRRARWARAGRRAAAEQRWSEFGDAHGLSVQHFRLAGIYGPMRNALVSLRWHGATYHKPGQVFSRIHVDDIARILLLLCIAI